MIRGVRASVSAMKAQLQRQEVLARNLGNHVVPAYKGENAAIAGFSAALARMDGSSLTREALLGGKAPMVGSLSTQVAVDGISVDFRQGELDHTGRALDVALVGDGFLRARTPAGDLLTRGGPLQLDSSRRLVTMEGHPVLGAQGEVMLREGMVSLESDGSVAVDGQVVAKLLVLEFEPGTRVMKLGDGFYAPEDQQVEPSVSIGATEVRGGFLEQSNVDHASTLTEMISLLRAYQASQRMIQSQDELLAKAVNEVGKV